MNIYEESAKLLLFNENRTYNVFGKTIPTKLEDTIRITEISEQDFYKATSDFYYFIKVKKASSSVSLFWFDSRTASEKVRNGEIRNNIFYAKREKRKFFGYEYFVEDCKNFYIKRNDKYYHIDGMVYDLSPKDSMKYTITYYNYFTNFVAISYKFRHTDLTDIYDLFYFITEL